MSKVAHYFIAIKLSKEMKHALRDLQHRLIDDVSYKEWVHEQDFHITLTFLGPANENIMTSLIKQLEQELLEKPFDLHITNVHTFGAPKQPRVLWLGIEATKTLNNLQQLVDSIAEQHGFPREKRSYTPHITLAKKWKDHSKTVELKAIRQKTDFPLEYVHVQHIAVYQIFPQEHPKYVPIHMIDLRSDYLGTTD